MLRPLRALHRTSRGLSAVALLGLLSLGGCGASPDGSDGPSIRIASFNTSLNRPGQGDLARDLAAGSEQARHTAAILQRIRPDVVLLAEFDHDSDGEALRLFRERYLAVAQHDDDPLAYPFAYRPEVNTGQPSGLDLDLDGTVGGAGDAWGYGTHPGQYGFVVLSRFPIQADAVRSFRELRWVDLPGHAIPEAHWPDDVTARLRLSSKSHVDVPVALPDGRTLHVLASHPTPPVFDGPEDRNGRRNHDEIRLWAEYLDGGEGAEWLVDDRGRAGGLPAGAHFVVVGDLNADPFDGDSFPSPDGRPAILQLLDHPRIRREAPFAVPSSRGAVIAAAEQAAANTTHRGPVEHDTGDFTDDPGPGNLRIDYVLPDNRLTLLDAGVFWPTPDDPGFDWISSSDHRLVWVDLR